VDVGVDVDVDVAGMRGSPSSLQGGTVGDDELM
jgi:hypothetical protein